MINKKKLYEIYVSKRPFALKKKLLKAYRKHSCNAFYTRFSTHKKDVLMVSRCFCKYPTFALKSCFYLLPLECLSFYKYFFIPLYTLLIEKVGRSTHIPYLTIYPPLHPYWSYYTNYIIYLYTYIYIWIYTTHYLINTLSPYFFR